MKIQWTLWILNILLFCERVASEKRLEIQISSNNGYNETMENNNTSTCRFAQLKCSYRTGCGQTLQSFIIECDSLINNQTEICTNRCKNTLVGLTSTPEGQKLMNCDCDGDLECEVAKVNIEACRDSGQSQSFTSLMEDLGQDIRTNSLQWNRCLNETIRLRECSVKILV